LPSPAQGGGMSTPHKKLREKAIVEVDANRCVNLKVQGLSLADAPTPEQEAQLYVRLVADGKEIAVTKSRPFTTTVYWPDEIDVATIEVGKRREIDLVVELYEVLSSKAALLASKTLSIPVWSPVQQAKEVTLPYASGRGVQKEIRAAFSAYDKDHSGTLDVSELRSALAFYGINVEDSGAVAMLEGYDDKPDGKLDLLEFARFVVDWKKMLGEEIKNRETLGFTKDDGGFQEERESVLSVTIEVSEIESSCAIL